MLPSLASCVFISVGIPQPSFPTHHPLDFPHPSNMQYLTSLRLAYPTTLIVLGCLIILFTVFAISMGVSLGERKDKEGSASSNARSTSLTASSSALASTQTTLPSIPTPSLAHSARPIYLAKNRTSSTILSTRCGILQQPATPAGKGKQNEPNASRQGKALISGPTR
jgi:hypothetical protein